MRQEREVQIGDKKIILNLRATGSFFAILFLSNHGLYYSLKMHLNQAKVLSQLTVIYIQ